MRTFGFNAAGIISAGQLLIELKKIGLPMSRMTLFRLEKRLRDSGVPYPEGTRTTGKHRWHLYSREDVTQIMDIFSREYGIKLEKDIANVVGSSNEEPETT